MEIRQALLGPYHVVSLTPTNAEVQLLNQPEGGTLFVALDRVRPCYDELSNDVWTGHRSHTTTSSKRKGQKIKSTQPAEPSPTGYQ